MQVLTKEHLQWIMANFPLNVFLSIDVKLEFENAIIGSTSKITLNRHKNIMIWTSDNQNWIQAKRQKNRERLQIMIKKEKSWK